MRIKCFLFEDDCVTEIPLYPHNDHRASYQLDAIADLICYEDIMPDEIDVVLIADSLRTIARKINPAKRLRIEILVSHDLITTSDDIDKCEILDAELEELVRKKILRLLKNLFDQETKSPF